MQLWHAIILAIIEGLTEYLPISSTGHIILGSWWMGIHQEPFTKDFTVMVQFGAILSVVAIYWRKFFHEWKTYLLLAVAFLPAAVIGLLVKDKIDLLLGSVWVVAVALLLGGVVLLFTKQLFRHHQNGKIDWSHLTWRHVLVIGLFQCLAFVPGVSRAASTIWGGLFVGLSLPLATQFSFLLAVPTLSGASLLKLLKAWPSLTGEQIQLLLIGNLISFIVGYIAIRSFIQWVSRKGLEPFGLYRIILAIVVIAVLMMGHDLTVL